MFDRKIHLTITRAPFLKAIAAGFLVLLTISSAMAEDFARVLVINSYHRGFHWSDTEESGFVERMLEAHPSADIPVEYLDTKRNPGDGHQRRMKDFLIAKYREKKIERSCSCPATPAT